jgi:hypothetical protein
MANNRMYLVHVPSGYGVFLGKRMLREWDNDDIETANKLDNLYYLIYREYGIEDNDNFQIFMEDANNAEFCSDKWKSCEYNEELKIFIFKGYK